MTKMLDLIEDYCYIRQHEYCRLDGSTRLEERQEQVRHEVPQSGNILPAHDGSFTGLLLSAYQWGSSCCCKNKQLKIYVHCNDTYKVFTSMCYDIYEVISMFVLFFLILDASV